MTPVPDASRPGHDAGQASHAVPSPDVMRSLHHACVHPRRVQTLCRHLAELIPRDATVLDVGCGDGLLTSALGQARPDLRVSGMDVLVRATTHVRVEAFDGRLIPRVDSDVDVVMLIDVLHHTDDPMVMLREAVRVARRAVVIKDHVVEGRLAVPTLRFMDWVGNARTGVSLPYNYWTRAMWMDAFDRLHVTVRVWRSELGLYPWPARLVFDRRLHVIAVLEASR